MIKKIFALAAATSLVATPALANPAASLSLSKSPAVRAATATKQANRQVESTGFIIAGIIAVVVVLELTGVINIIGGSDSD